MQLVRGSEVQDFLRCRLRWQYAWVDGYRSKQLNDKLFVGSLVHKFLEAYHSPEYGYKDARRFMYEMFKESNDMSQEAVDAYNLAVKVTDNYAGHYLMESLDVIATELQFAIPLQNDIVYTGTIDLIYKVGDQLYFMDHKTTASIDKYEKNAIMDRQISRYWWALQQLARGNGYVMENNEWVGVWESGCGIVDEPSGFMYNIILKDYPVPPKVLQSGKLSKDKAQKTTYELYLQELRDRGLLNFEPNDMLGGFVETLPEEYWDIMDHLKNSPKEFFRRTEVIRSQAEIDDSMREFYNTVEDMNSLIDSQGNLSYNRIYRNITSDCHWMCAFKDVCKASLDGSDARYLLNIGFDKDGGRSEEHLSDNRGYNDDLHE